MRSRILVVLGLILAVVPLSIAESAPPVNCAHLLAWLAADVPTYNLARTIGLRGSLLSLTPRIEAELRAAGATTELLDMLRRVHPKNADACPASLAQAAADSRKKNFDDAEAIISGLLQDDPHNGALHFALGYLNQQQGHWDEAFDEYSSSKESEPDFPAVHNRLALVFYQADDGDDAIGEARTALSMDFEDAEAYRMLGLGHYSNEQYEAAMNAFKEHRHAIPRTLRSITKWGWWLVTRVRRTRRFNFCESRCS